MLLAVSLFIILSSELLNMMDMAGQKGSYKLGLSIFWGIYSLILVSLGISFGRKHLRISAIVLFAITLAKLFFLDIENLDTLSKTAVFVSLGVLLRRLLKGRQGVDPELFAVAGGRAVPDGIGDEGRGAVGVVDVRHCHPPVRHGEVGIVHCRLTE